MSYVIEPPTVTSLPIIGSEQRFPIRRVFCIGRNYAEHAREMGSAVDKETPPFFCKPADAVVTDGADVRYPSATHDLHHELEMVVALGRGGTDIPVEAAKALIWGYAIGLDLTRRDLQSIAKEKRMPWDAAKGFDDSAPVSAIFPASQGAPTGDTWMRLSVNGKERQVTQLSDMVFNVAEIIALLSRLFELKAGDLIFTGTPSGVAALQRGDTFRAELDGFAVLEARVS